MGNDSLQNPRGSFLKAMYVCSRYFSLLSLQNKTQYIQLSFACRFPLMPVHLEGKV